MTYELKKQVMRRVYLAYIARKASSPLAKKVYALTALLFISSIDVSFGHVLHNMPKFSDPQVWGFSWYAFNHTEFLVKILAVVMAGVLALLLRDVMRALPLRRVFAFGQ